MSSFQGKAYLDSIQGYLAPRLYQLMYACSATSSTTTVAECNSYTWNGQTYNQPGNYTFQATNSVGCDSIATLHLTITPNYADNQSYVLCGGQTVTVNGTTYSQAGQYTQQIAGTNGCDTVLTIGVTSEQSPSVNILGNSQISANSTETYAIVNPVGYNMTWSVTNGTILSGQGTVSATIFWTAAGGDVSVTLNNGNCSYTFTLPVGTFVGINEHWLNDLMIHPNPSNGSFNLELVEPTQIFVFDSQGKNIMNVIGNGQFSLDLTAFPIGIYSFQLQTETGQLVKRVMKY